VRFKGWDAVLFDGVMCDTVGASKDVKETPFSTPFPSPFQLLHFLVFSCFSLAMGILFD
jgi:hypothetical protein